MSASRSRRCFPRSRCARRWTRCSSRRAGRCADGRLRARPRALRGDDRGEPDVRGQRHGNAHEDREPRADPAARRARISGRPSCDSRQGDAKDAAARYATASELADALEAASSTHDEVAALLGTPSPPVRTRRRGWRTAVVASLALGVVLLAATRRGDARVKPTIAERAPPPLDEPLVVSKPIALTVDAPPPPAPPRAEKRSAPAHPPPAASVIPRDVLRSRD